jgi:hypothetical protein
MLGKRTTMTSEKARGFIARKIAKNIDEGKDAKTAQAIAFSQARQEGFKVPPPPGIRAAERRR